MRGGRRELGVERGIPAVADGADLTGEAALQIGAAVYNLTWAANARIVLSEILAALGLPDLDAPWPQLSVGDLS